VDGGKGWMGKEGVGVPMIAATRAMIVAMRDCIVRGIARMCAKMDCFIAGVLIVGRVCVSLILIRRCGWWCAV